MYKAFRSAAQMIRHAADFRIAVGRFIHALLGWIAFGRGSRPFAVWDAGRLGSHYDVHGHGYRPGLIASRPVPG